MIYPIVEYAHKIGKNTAEFTAKDMAAFMKWWMDQPNKENVIMAIKKQQTRAAQVVKQLNDENVEEVIEEMALEELEEEAQEQEAVCSMDLTQADVDALKWGISQLLNDYDLAEHVHGASLGGLLEGLEGV